MNLSNLKNNKSSLCHLSLTSPLQTQKKLKRELWSNGGTFKKTLKEDWQQQWGERNKSYLIVKKNFEKVSHCDHIKKTWIRILGEFKCKNKHPHFHLEIRNHKMNLHFRFFQNLLLIHIRRQLINLTQKKFPILSTNPQAKNLNMTTHFSKWSKKWKKKIPMNLFSQPWSTKFLKNRLN